MASNDARDAVEAIFGGLQSAFKKYNRPTRTRAWNAVVSAQGRAQVDKILNSPDRKLVGLSRLVSFKEWLEANPS